MSEFICSVFQLRLSRSILIYISLFINYIGCETFQLLPILSFKLSSTLDVTTITITDYDNWLSLWLSLCICKDRDSLFNFIFIFIL